LPHPIGLGVVAFTYNLSYARGGESIAVWGDVQFSSPISTNSWVQKHNCHPSYSKKYKTGRSQSRLIQAKIKNKIARPYL
jgi:hypothetical protein